MSAHTKDSLCAELAPALSKWHQVVSAAGQAKDRMLSAATEEEYGRAKDDFLSAAQGVTQAREQYHAVANQAVSYQEKTIIRKDVLLLMDIEEKVGKVNSYEVSSQRITALDLNDKDLSAGSIHFPAGVQRLDLDRATLPDNLKIPDSVQTLWLDGATLPNNLKLPDGVQRLYLSRITTFPNNLKIPAGVQWLGLNGATLPDNLEIPDSVQTLWLNNATFRDQSGDKYPVHEHPGFMKQLRELKHKNPHLEINGVEV